MSCATLNTTALNLNVSVANLPEGFCPANMQELANAIGARLIISPNTSFNTFAIGSTSPASNQGPWYKDCNQWFVYDDATGTYLPIANTTPGGWRTEIYSTTSGSFTVPAYIYKLEVEIWGAGGGGGTETGGIPNGGGGGGGYCKKLFDVLPNQIIPYTVGTGGASGAPGTTGGTTTFLTLTATGGTGGTGGANRDGGLGGTGTGGDVNIKGQNGDLGSDAGGGAGGDSPRGGAGGTFFVTVFTPSRYAGIVPGGGGSGGFSVGAGVGGAGASGAVFIRY